MSTTTQRPTPETDDAVRKGAYLTHGEYPETCGKQIVHIDFARKLERERDEAREQLEAMCVAIKEACEALKAISRSTDYAGDHGSAMVATKDAITAKTALAKLQPYIKP